MSERRTGPWLGAALLAAFAATSLEAMLIQVRYRTFTGGFLNPVFLEGLQVPLFFVASLLIDLAAVLLFAPIAIRLTRGIERPGRRLLAVAVLVWLPWAGCALQRLGAFAYARDWFGFQFDLTPGVAALVVAVVLLLPLAATLWAGRFIPERIATRLSLGSATPRRALIGGGLVLLCAFLLVPVAGFADGGFQLQLRRKTSGAWITGLGEFVTDVDGDGYGLFRQPADFAPFDGDRHLWAVDHPANGVDENGVGGDLARAGEFTEEKYAPVEFVRKPDVVVLVLETFPAHALEASVDGKPATPVLKRLIGAGAVTGPVYTHNAYTVPSLAHLFSGSLTNTVKSSIIDDFAANGYYTACVSGQDESFGGLEDITGVRRADSFRDARDDVGERTSTSTDPGSLTVPWQVVVRNVEQLLGAYGKQERPLFCYVNLQDAHFPYVHRKTERILTEDLVSRDEMGPVHERRIRRTYLNAAANVDRAVGRVLDAWRDIRGRAPAYVILADHGENIWENGMLGHGIALNRHQTRIVFLTHGFPVSCTFPIGPADVRRLLRHGLTGPEIAAPQTDPNKWIFQYVGSLDAPLQLGAAADSGGIVYDVIHRRWSSWGRPPNALSTPHPELLQLWEQIRLERWRAAQAAGAVNSGN